MQNSRFEFKTVPQAIQACNIVAAYGYTATVNRYANIGEVCVTDSTDFAAEIMVLHGGEPLLRKKIMLPLARGRYASLKGGLAPDVKSAVLAVLGTEGFLPIQAANLNGVTFANVANPVALNLLNLYDVWDDGYTFGLDTPVSVKVALMNCKDSNHRVRFWYGDPKTGEAWLEESDVYGFVGFSTGRSKIPLILKNRHSLDGPGILDGCIVKLAVNNRIAYEHPTYRLPKLTIVPSDRLGYVAAVTDESGIVARFKTTDEAQRYVDFMDGKQMQI